jgi:hypothetical protein
MRLTASALPRAAACLGSCVLPAIPESGEYADTGTAIDKYIQGAKTLGREVADKQAPPEMLPYLRALPLDKIPDGCEYQVAFAWSALTGEVRRIPSRQDGYPTDMGPEWIFGSTDIVGMRPGRALVWDIKWGTSTMGRDPAEDLQLGFLSMCAAKFCGVAECETGFLRADWKGDLHPDTAVLGELALDSIEDEVRELWRRQQDALYPRGQDAALGCTPADAEELAGVPLSVGSHCTYCPARRACPAMMQPVALAIAGNLGELAAESLPAIEVAKESIAALALVDKGRLYERLEAAEGYLGMLRGILRDDARLEPLPLSGGKELREVQWGTSQKSPVAQAELAALTEVLKERGEIKTVKVAQVRTMKGRT